MFFDSVMDPDLHGSALFWLSFIPNKDPNPRARNFTTLLTNKPEFQSLFHVKNITFLWRQSLARIRIRMAPWIRIRTETNADP